MSSVATAIVGGAVVGGLITANGAQSAANTQASAANNATATQQAMFNQTQQNLQPYMQAGKQYNNMLTQQMPNLIQGFNPTMQQLQSMPGYNFEMQQGLEAAQNGFAAKGLGSSGAAMKGAAQYAQGLASNDINNLANIYYTNQGNAYNRLMAGTQMGANAAAGLGQTGAQYANGISNTITGAGNALAAGQVGSANAIANGLTGGINSYMGYNMAQNAINANTFNNATSPMNMLSSGSQITAGDPYASMYGIV